MKIVVKEDLIKNIHVLNLRYKQKMKSIALFFFLVRLQKNGEGKKRPHSEVGVFNFLGDFAAKNTHQSSVLFLCRSPTLFVLGECSWSCRSSQRARDVGFSLLALWDLCRGR